MSQPSPLSDFDWLMVWFERQCDGAWEHGNGITIESLDNPGWAVSIEMEGTALEGRSFTEKTHNLDSEVSWWACRLDGTVWKAACGPGDLASVIGIFRSWAILEPQP